MSKADVESLQASLKSEISTPKQSNKDKGDVLSKKDDEQSLRARDERGEGAGDKDAQDAQTELTQEMSENSLGEEKREEVGIQSNRFVFIIPLSGILPPLEQFCFWHLPSFDFSIRQNTANCFFNTS